MARRDPKEVPTRPTSTPLGVVLYLAAPIPCIRDAIAANNLDGVTDWQEFLDASVGGQAAVVVLPDLTTSAWDAILAFKQSRPLFPLLLVTTYSRENARCLKDIVVEGVLFLDEVATQLGRALRQLARESPLARAADAIRAMPHLDSDLAEVLGRACMRTHPLRHVAELAALLGYDRTTLTRRWNHVIAPPSHPHLFIDWLLVTHALMLRARGNRSWTCLASELGVRDRTLQEAARRAFHRPLKQLVPLETHGILVALTRIIGCGERQAFAEKRAAPQERPQCSISAVPRLLLRDSH